MITQFDNIYQHVIFDKARWMLIRDRLFKLPLVPKKSVHGLYI